MNFRNQILKVKVTQYKTTFSLEGASALTIVLNKKAITVSN
ncbi:glycosyl hydrolase family 65 protein [Zhouia sp. PK063]